MAVSIPASQIQNPQVDRSAVAGPDGATDFHGYGPFDINCQCVLRKTAPDARTNFKVLCFAGADQATVSFARSNAPRWPNSSFSSRRRHHIVRLVDHWARRRLGYESDRLN